LKREALSRIAAGTYGNKIPIPSRQPIIVRGKYIREGHFCTGDIADLHVASMESSKERNNLVMKVARSADDNDLLMAEVDTLALLRGRLSDAWKRCVPEILETFLLDEGAKVQRRRANISKRFAGFHDSVDIHRHVPGGVDGGTIAWMWKRLLVLLEWTHKAGLVHGAVLPPHLLFYPDNGNKKFMDPRQHTVVLVDWCYAVEYKKRTRLSAWIPQWKELYAPEVLKKQPLGAYTDLYMGAMSMLYLAGWEVGRKSLPAHIPAEINRSLLDCIYVDPTNRPQSIGKYFESFQGVLKKVYGVSRYHEFSVPGL
jgi:hypothetical protein